MKKNRFVEANPTPESIVEYLKTERTSQGDTITLKVKFNGQKKPNVYLAFSTFDPTKFNFSKEEEITDWVDEHYSYEIMDDTTGKPMEGEFTRGNSSWKEYIDQRFGPMVRSIVKTGGRIFQYEEIK